LSSLHPYTHFYQIYSAIEEYKTGEPIALQFKEVQYVAIYQELIETWAAFVDADIPDAAIPRSTAVLASINAAVLYVSIPIRLQQC
jgi:hypothetical protein